MFMTHRTPFLMATVALAALSVTSSAQETPAPEKPPAVAKASPARTTADWIRDLASEDFRTREDATTALAASSGEALPLLERAAQDKDPEVRWRAEQAIRAIKARGGKAAEGQGAPAGAKEAPKAGDVPGGAAGAAAEALEGAKQRLKAVEEEMARQRPRLGELFRGFGGGNGNGNDLFGGDFSKIMEELERQMRDLERGGGFGNGGGPGGGFWSFRWNNGQWEMVGPGASAASRLGVRTQPVSPVLRAQLRLAASPEGIVLEDVSAGGGVAKAGLEAFDIVLRVDGAGVAAESDLAKLLEPGTHTIDIVRGGERQSLTSVIEKAPEPAPAPKGKTATPPASGEPGTTPPPARKPELRRY